MNENVTNKTPKRRRWIARLLVSALCILLASSLLFFSVVAENVNTYTFELIDQSSSDTHSFYGYFYGSDGFFGLSELVMAPSGFYFYGTSYLYENSYSSPLFQLEYSGDFGTNFAILSVGSSSLGYWVLYSYGSTYYAECFNWSGFRTVSASTEGAFYTTSQNSNRYFCYFSLDGYAFSGGINDSTFVYSNGVKTNVDGYYNCLIYGDGSYFALSSNRSDYAFDLADYSFCSNAQSFGVSTAYYSRSFGDTLCLYYPGNFGIGKFNCVFSIDDGVLSYSSASGSFVSNLAYNLCFLGSVSGNSFSNTEIGRGWSFVRTGDALTSYKIGVIYATSSEFVPSESSDETTTEPPPESSEESSIGGVIDLYSYDKLSDGSYQSAQIGTLDLTDATGLRVFLGMYLLGDNVWSDIKTPLTLLVYREDGSLDTYTYDYYAAGFAWGDGSPGSFTFPKFIGGYFDIPLSSSSELYFASSAPGGTIWLQNNSVVLRQINLLNSDSYVELENVSAEECIISVYDSPSDEDPESYVYTSGVLKYTLRKRNSSSSIPVSLDYGETGIVHGVMKYNGADFIVSSIILSSDPDLMPPIYDFESMDNALSEAYDDVSRQQYLENLLTSYIENAYGTVSYDPDTSGAFLGGVDLMGDIVDSSGGSTIISAFVNMWSIHPFFPAMVGLLGTFLIFSFFLRKA